jgi:predicted dienelactone hydrolase
LADRRWPFGRGDRGLCSDTVCTVNPIPWLSLYPVECVAVLAAVAMAVVRWLPEQSRRAVAVGAMVVAVVAVVALLFTGVRWQLVPVLVAMLLALPAVIPAIVPDRRRAPRWLAVPGTIILAGLVVLGPVTAWALPVPAFPTPTGRYPVGTTVLQWTDADRPETATTAPNDRRTVVAQLWYPAADSGGEHAPYFGRTPEEARTVAEGLSSYVGLPGFVLDSLALARTAAVLDAKPLSGNRPVVLFSPGLGGVRGQNSVWAIDLASRGYVVVALDHPYDSAAVVLNDGTVVRTRVAATGDDDQDRRLGTNWATVRAEDLSFALTRLKTSPFAGLLDLDRVAVTGHSLGGGAALMAARMDHRFAAVIDLDGFPYDPAPQPFPQPVLIINHQLLPGESAEFLPTADRVLGLSAAGGYRLQIPGSAHLTFTDAPIWLPPVPSVVGTQSRYEGPALTAQITALFLDHAFNSKPGLDAELSRFGSLASRS